MQNLPSVLYCAIAGSALSAAALERHAIFLVGYNNIEEWWLVKNSWGTGFADGGFFRLSYAAHVNLLDPSETFGLKFKLGCPPPLPKVTNATGRTGCYSYKAMASDYISKVARTFGSSIEQVLSDNLGLVKGDPGSFLGGKTLVLCNIKPPFAQVCKSVRSQESQLRALLGLHTTIDPNHVLKDWGVDGDSSYCDWRGVRCDQKCMVVQLSPPRGRLGGELPSGLQLQLLSRLRVVDFTELGMTGPLPTGWEKLTSLRVLQLANNTLAGTLPASWSALLGLQAIDLTSNAFTGSLPVPWSTLKQLRQLSVYNNSLTGTLPVSWSSMASLQSVCLGWLNLPCADNRLSGSVPAAWSAMQQLVLLSLSCNQFTGTLPASWEALSKMGALELSYNKFSGSLPASWSAWRESVVVLGAHNNQISGPLPAYWARMRKLKYLELWNNHLTGTLPARWSSMHAVVALGSAEFD